MLMLLVEFPLYTEGCDYLLLLLLLLLLRLFLRILFKRFAASGPNVATHSFQAGLRSR